MTLLPDESLLIVSGQINNLMHLVRIDPAGGIIIDPSYSYNDNLSVEIMKILNS